MKDADDGGVAALEDADDAALAAAIGFGRLHFNQHLVALHGAVDLVGRNEDIFVGARTAWRLRLGPDKAEAVAMQVEPAGSEVVARAASAGPGNAPVFAVQLGQLRRAR